MTLLGNIVNDVSPTLARTWRSGKASRTAIAPGRPNLILAKSRPHHRSDGFIRRGPEEPASLDPPAFLAPASDRHPWPRPDRVAHDQPTGAEGRRLRDRGAPRAIVPAGRSAAGHRRGRPLHGVRAGLAIHQAHDGTDWRADPLILDDQALIANVRGRGLVVLTGCGHAGVVNILRYARRLTGVNDVHAILGGLHLTGPLFAPIIPPTVAALQELAPRCHRPRTLHRVGCDARHRDGTARGVHSQPRRDPLRLLRHPLTPLDPRQLRGPHEGGARRPPSRLPAVEPWIDGERPPPRPWAMPSRHQRGFLDSEVDGLGRQVWQADVETWKDLVCIVTHEVSRLR